MSEIINPQDAELEEIILGSCLIESKAITLIADILRPEAFYNEKNLEIYATSQSMYRNGQKIDIITVKEELARRGKLEFIGGPYTLAHISGRVASVLTSNIMHGFLNRNISVVKRFWDSTSFWRWLPTKPPI